ncbi:hypothetical protein DC522_09475 [Microvirga sp. KLBC 81]|uniref:hypothetical protein n=1 Tax=Microvirga sp. KLBC 81 TaxID=1862707 RepID=UPI000D51F559|nr:hypothetical protein [Microvirga sp. KLBC 81]PVE24564.1 hypothetical protein DC522_09475 [Microvirga sp. KLBC 81]
MAHLKQNNYKELYRKDCTGSPSIDSMMREVLHRLGDIDAEYEIRLDQVERSCVDQELKSHIRKKIRAAHYERREPYVELLTTLRQRQHRLSFTQ